MADLGLAAPGGQDDELLRRAMAAGLLPQPGAQPGAQPPTAPPTLGASVAPPVQPTLGAMTAGPKQQSYEQQMANAPAAPTGIKGALLNIAGGIPLGRMIEQAIPGSRANYDANLPRFKAASDEEQAATGQALGREKEDVGMLDTESQIGEREANARRADAAAREQDASAQAKLNPPAKPVNPAQVAALAKIGYKMDEDGNPVPLTDEEISPELKNQRAFQGAATDLKKAQTALSNSKNDPNSAAYRLEKARVDEAKERVNQASDAMGLRREEFADKQQNEGYVKPTGQVTSRGSAAFSAQQMIDKILPDVQQNAASLGPIMGRLSRGEMKLGNVDPKVAALYTQLGQLYAIMGAAHGWRNIQVTTEFQKFIGGLERNPAALTASLQAARQSMDPIVTEGRTAHPLIKEGQPAAAATAPTQSGGFKAPADAPAPPKEDGHKLKANGQVIAISKGGAWVQP